MNALKWSILTAALAACAPAALAQYVPAGMQGVWKVHKRLNTPAAAAPCSSSILTLADRGKNISLGDHSVIWKGETVDPIQPQIKTLNAYDFTSQYLNGGTLHDLGMSGAQVQLITLGNAGNLPFDIVIAKNPSTLIFGKCGVFYDAVRNGSFRAPKIP